MSPRRGEILLKKLVTVVFVPVILTLGFIQTASALELDWSGQFRSEFNYIKTYTLDGNATQNGLDAARVAGKGYYIPEGGSNDAQFQSLFLKLQPKLIVNDNISIKSEWWVGDPVYGFFGSAAPYDFDKQQYNETYSRGASITAQRIWGEFLTDFGTLKIGRAPLQYGLGLVWNSGDDLWSHYESTGDTVSLVSKFGAFSFIPSFVSYSTGNNIGGNCQGPNSVTAPQGCTPLAGSGGLSDYSLQIKYENLDEDFDAGLNFIRRIAGGAQDPTSGTQWDGGATSLNYNTYDIYVKKKVGKLSMAAEIPVVNGSAGGVSYSTWAFAAETDLRTSDSWDLGLKFGHAPGQPNDVSQVPASYKGFYFNPNYQVALIMFNYQFANFAGPNTLNNPNVAPAKLASPYDNPIMDANYVAFTPTLHADKWQFHATYLFAKAPDTAAPNSFFWNNRLRQNVSNATTETQSTSLGWEMDYGAQFQYDQYFVFKLDAGVWFPGAFYAFSNAPGDDNPTNAVLAAVARVGVSF
jgi:hypothetical protein